MYVLYVYFDVTRMISCNVPNFVKSNTYLKADRNHGLGDLVEKIIMDVCIFFCFVSCIKASFQIKVCFFWH